MTFAAESRVVASTYRLRGETAAYTPASGAPDATLTVIYEARVQMLTPAGYEHLDRIRCYQADISEPTQGDRLEIAAGTFELDAWEPDETGLEWVLTMRKVLT